MPLNFKIFNGTKSGCEKSLCEHCINGQVTEGFGARQKFVVCSTNFEHPIEIFWSVAQCNEFRERESISLALMKEMAWHISPKVRGKVGFTPPGPGRDKAAEQFITDVKEILGEKRMEPTKGLIQVSGMYKDGRVFLKDKKYPFQAELGMDIQGMATIHITLLVNKQVAGDVLSGLASGADLTLDNVPNLIDQ